MQAPPRVRLRAPLRAPLRTRVGARAPLPLHARLACAAGSKNARTQRERCAINAVLEQKRGALLAPVFRASFLDRLILVVVKMGPGKRAPKMDLENGHWGGLLGRPGPRIGSLVPCPETGLAGVGWSVEAAWDGLAGAFLVLFLGRPVGFGTETKRGFPKPPRGGGRRELRIAFLLWPLPTRHAEVETARRVCVCHSPNWFLASVLDKGSLRASVKIPRTAREKALVRLL